MLEELVRARDTTMAAGSPRRPTRRPGWWPPFSTTALNTPWGRRQCLARQPLVVMLRGASPVRSSSVETGRHPNRDRDAEPQATQRSAFAASIECLAGPATVAQCVAWQRRPRYRPEGRCRTEGRAIDGRTLHSDRVMALTQRLSPPRSMVGRPGLAGGELSALVRAAASHARRHQPRSPKVGAAAGGGLSAGIPAGAGHSRTALHAPKAFPLARLIIRSNPELFQSSRAQLTEGFEPLIDSIAKVILANQDLIGNITVVGHTDSVPLQRTNPLSTNQRLSEARAATIADMLVQIGVPQDRVHSEGRAATDPVADDSTREGRALNRRVEVLVEKRL